MKMKFQLVSSWKDSSLARYPEVIACEPVRPSNQGCWNHDSNAKEDLIVLT